MLFRSLVNAHESSPACCIDVASALHAVAGADSTINTEEVPHVVGMPHEYAIFRMLVGGWSGERVAGIEPASPAWKNDPACSTPFDAVATNRPNHAWLTRKHALRRISATHASKRVSARDVASMLHGSAS